MVRPPETLSLDGGNPSVAWDKWKRRFEIFLQATGASGKPDIVKVGLLLNHIGDEGIEIYTNFVFRDRRPDPDNAEAELPAESKDNFETVLQKYDGHFNKRDPQLMLRKQF